MHACSNNKMLLPAIFLCIAGCTAFATAESKGYIFTASRVLNQNAYNEMQLSLLGFEAPGEVTIRLLKSDNDTVIAENTVAIEKGTAHSVIPFYVPSVDAYEARLQIEGEFQTGEDEPYKIHGEDKVNFRSAQTNVVFIQTDKPMYKTSQDVRFRVLALDSNLRPLGKETVGNIRIEDPSGYRMAQWNNVSLGTGVVQRYFPLANEPPLGTWTIFATVNGSENSATFEVKEYVLPKFEVVIKTPPFILIDAETIPIEVCAKYTYGKMVEGDLNLTVSLERYSWAVNKFPIQEIVEKLDNGCYEYIINVTVIDPEYQYSYRRIQIFSSIVEKGTGVVRNETKFIDRTSSPLNLNFEFGYREYIKPGLPFKGTIKVSNPDDTPAADEPLSVCAVVTRERVLSDWWATKKMQHCSNLTSNAEGKVYFTVLPQSTDAVSVSLQAKSLKYTEKRPKDSKKPILYQPMSSSYLRPWFSPSGSHIQIQPIEDALPCGETAKIQVFYTAKENADYRLYYMIISRGKVYEQDYVDVEFKEEDAITEYSNSTLDQENVQVLPKSDPTSSGEGESSSDNEEDNKCKAIKEAKYVPFVGSAAIEVDVKFILAPSFHLIVYYHREDREIVADSHQFKVEKCFDNQVTLTFDAEVKQPGAETLISLSTSPKSICGIKIVDKSVSLLDSNDQLTKEKVYSAIEQLNGGQFYPKNHCNDKKPQAGLEKKVSGLSYLPPRPPPGWSSSPFEDTLTAYETAGLFLVTDFTALTRPCKNSDGAYDRPASGFGGGVRGGVYDTSTVASRRPVAAAALAAESSPHLKEGSTESLVDVRDYFPETWLFDLEVTENGELSRTDTLPHTITEWVGSALCINKELGLGLSETASIKGFQEFFMSFTLPYSSIRGEKLPVIVTAFSYTDKCLPITFELEESEDFDLVSDSALVDVCLCSGKSETYKYMIQPKVIGTLNLTVAGRTSDSGDICGDQGTSDAVARDAVKNPLIVEAEGFPVTEVENYLFCPQDSEDDTYEKKISFVLPEDVVEGSERAYITFTGDIMGPSIDNLDRLVQLPTGCGEQNMVKLAPIVDILNYLSATNKLTEELEKKAKDFILRGYQRQLQYRHSDGSFSAFGNTDKEGSIWLTAFTLRSLSEATKYVAIDSKQLEESANWIISKQEENGCFPQVGRVFNSAMMGGVTGSNSSRPLTAYILASLIISGYKNDSIVSGALSCIKEEDQPSSYQLSLFAYAAALAGSEDKAKEYLTMLHGRANTTGGVTFFPSKGRSKSEEIETAGYAILAQLELDQPLEESLPIVRWLTQKRNANGGFRSTQDTVIGLKALSEFATLLGKDPVDLNIAVSGSLTVNAQVTDEDRLVVQKYKVPSVPSDNAVKATGTGCGLLQASLLYNTKQAKKRDYFALSVEASPSPQDECRFSTLKVCASYIPEDQKSNMALIQIKMVSGYSPLKESLSSLKGNRELAMKRVDVENNEVSFYFDELDNAGKCFEFTVEKVLPVEDTKPGTAKVLDYYATERMEETSYEIEKCQ